jgi:5-aminopentanamidase
MSGDVTRVACCQLDPKILDVTGNIARATQAIAAAVAIGAQIVVLPELACSGYVFETREEAESVALTPGDARLRPWIGAITDTGALLVAGICERGDDENLYDSAVLLDSGGVLAVYRKTHLWNREKRIFTPGDRLAPVVSTRYGNLGLLICYDIEFPEVPRSLVLGGADLLIVPTNWSALPRPAGEHPPQVLNVRAAARASHVFVAACDRSGIERGLVWTGGTSIIDPDGWIAAVPGGDGIAVADLALRSARDRQVSDFNHVLTDRRPELYRC